MANRSLTVLVSGFLGIAVAALLLFAPRQRAATPQPPQSAQAASPQSGAPAPRSTAPRGESVTQHGLDLGQFPPYNPPRLPDGHPDLNGYWQAMVTADWDLLDHQAGPGPKPAINGVYGAEPPGLSIVEGGTIPYRPDALAKKKKNFETRTMVDVSNDATWHDLGDPEMKCYMPGVPRAEYMPYPFRIVQSAGTASPFLMISYEFASATRIIRMNSKLEAPIPSWMGWSRGHWEGDTLVIDVTGFRPETWFDRVGDYHSDELHVVERFTAVSPFHLMYEATIEDPKVFTRPWKIQFPLYRRMEKDFQILEFKCPPFTEEMLYGRFVKKTAK